MKIFALLTVICAALYVGVIKAAAFMCSLFLLTLVTVGMYDLVIWPWVKRYRLNSQRRAA